MRKDIIREEHLKKYFEITFKALNIAKRAINKKRQKDALAVIDMCQRYYDDAKYFYEKQDYVNAFASLNYSHGWIDAGSKIGLFNVKDSQLFVIK